MVFTLLYERLINPKSFEQENFNSIHNLYTKLHLSPEEVRVKM